MHVRSEIRGRCLGIVIGTEKLFIVSDLYLLNTMDITICRKRKKNKAHLLSKPSPIVFKSKASHGLSIDRAPAQTEEERKRSQEEKKMLESI